MKVEINDIVKVDRAEMGIPRWYYGVVTGFYEFGLFIQTRHDMEPICFSWKANKITVIKEMVSKHEKD